MKQKLLFCLAAFLLPLCGIFACLAMLGRFYDTFFLRLEFFWWAVFSIVSLVGAIVALFFSWPEEKPSPPPIAPEPPEPVLDPEVEKFMKECKLAIRGHLKLSLIFWILAYRKEKVKSFEDAKKEVFSEIKKEIPHVRWMDAILNEVKDELGKTKH